MKKYKSPLYVEPTEKDQVREVILTEEDILKEYWDYWSQKMSEKYGPDFQGITSENCILDWVTVNWAMEVI